MRVLLTGAGGDSKTGVSHTGYGIVNEAPGTGNTVL